MFRFWQDIVFGWRQIWKSPVFSLITVLSLAVGVGANTVVFSWLESLVIRPLPGVAGCERMVVFTFVSPSGEGHGLSYPEIQDLSAHHEIFAGVVGSSQSLFRLQDGEHQQWIWAQPATGNLFQVLEVKPFLGRTFDPGSADKPSANPEIVISYRCWERFFGSDPRILERTVQLSRQSFHIVGVAPPDFNGTQGGLHFDVWVPAVFQQQLKVGGPLNERDARWLYAMAKLQPGVSFSQARAVTELVCRQLEKTYPETNRNCSFQLYHIWQSPYGSPGLFSRLLFILFVVTALVLLLILTNLANLLLAKATTRYKELAIRQAMGASRLRLMRQLLTEIFVLGLLGGVGGAVLAMWGIDLFIWLLPPSIFPIFRELRLETNALLFAILLAILSGILFGLIPSFQLSGRGNCHETLKTDGRVAGTTRSHQRLRDALVVAETALATVLLVSAGLCLKSFQNARQANFGFDPRNVLVAPVGVSSGDVGEAELRNYNRRLLEAVRSIPSVEDVGSSGSWLLLARQGTQDADIQAEQYQPKPGESMAFPYAVISPSFLKTLRIPLLEGRDFTEADDQQAPGAVIINKTMAQRLWPRQMAVGRHILLDKRSFQVIGVAGNSKYSLPDEPPLPFMFFHFLQVHGSPPILYIRSTEDPSRMIKTLERLIQSLDPNFQLYNPLPMTQHLEIAVVNQRIAAQILMALGILAFLLAALGIYGVLAFIVAQRTREIGVRMALGARPGAILGMVMRQGLKFILTGIILGVALALILSQHFAGLLWGVRPFDPIIYTSVVLFFALVGLWACYLPARHATRVDPIVALHRE